MRLRTWLMKFGETDRVYVEENGHIYYSDKWSHHPWTKWRLARHAKVARGNKLHTWHGIADLAGTIERKLRRSEICALGSPQP